MVSTEQQSVENQVRELKQVAERRACTVVEIYRDAGKRGPIISQMVNVKGSRG
jgi:DNA invertase Pin-like site-specific DNA recombinase